MKDLPQYLKTTTLGHKLERLNPDDLGNVRNASRVRDDLCNKQTALEIILAAIAASHPVGAGRSIRSRTDQRVGKAVALLVGGGKASKRGPKGHVSDDVILAEVATRYHHHVYLEDMALPEVGPLILSALQSSDRGRGFHPRK